MHVQGLPAWSKATLQRHARDAREVYSRQQLEQGQTGDAFWDASQQQLASTGAQLWCPPSWRHAPAVLTHTPVSTDAAVDRPCGGFLALWGVCTSPCCGPLFWRTTLAARRAFGLV